MPHRFGRGFHLLVWDGAVRLQGVTAERRSSVAGGFFQGMTQIGSAIGLSVSTIVYNKVLRTQSGRLGVSAGLQGGDSESGDATSQAAQLKAYQAAMWTGFALGMFCTILCLFLHGVGVVGEVSAAKEFIL
ncbi:hypothetical protein BC827DRAFT_1152808 [Russula dissimulans]|nr:hypothetical protein BC827DRAFT_1152808 [Russula dissimulans]